MLRHGAGGFTSPPKEVMLRIFIALKSPSLSTKSEHTNLGSNGKYDKHYTTENDKHLHLFTPICVTFSVLHFTALSQQLDYTEWTDFLNRLPPAV
jgi:hypothetical protein